MPALPIPAEIEQAFKAYPPAITAKLKSLRALIFTTWAETEIDVPLTETLKWGQPAYLPGRPRIGSTIRLGATKDQTKAALFVHCQTTILPDFRDIHPDTFQTEGNRAVLLSASEQLPTTALGHLIASALTYHQR